MYKFKDKILCSKEEFVGYMVSKLNLTSDDVVLIDRSTDIGQSIIMNCKPARVGTVVHADHFSERIQMTIIFYGIISMSMNLICINILISIFVQHKHRVI